MRLTNKSTRQQFIKGFRLGAPQKAVFALLIAALVTIPLWPRIDSSRSSASAQDESSARQTQNAAPPQVPCVPPPSGMMAWWPLDEANGSATVRDLAGFNNQGVPKPGSPLGSANAPQAVGGRVGGALNFNSNQQTNGPNIEVPNHSELNFGVGDFSIDAWTLVPKPNAVYIHPVVDKLVVNSAGTQGTGYALYLVSSSSVGARLQLVIGSGGPLANFLSPPAPLVPFNTWTHIAATLNRSSNAVTFYINGTALLASGAIPAGSITNALPLLIGESRQPGLVQAALTLDEIELFNRALNQNEIKAIANAGSAGKCKCLAIIKEQVSCHGTAFAYTFTFTNFTGFPVSVLNFAPSSSFTISPNPVTFAPLPPGGSKTVTVMISGPAAVPGATICFYVGLAGPAAPACRIQHCITLPHCNYLPDLTIKKTVSCTGPGLPLVCKVNLTITNIGPGNFNGILTLKDLVTPAPSPGLTWASSSTPPGFSCGIGPSDTISCGGTSAVSLTPGQSTSLSVAVHAPFGHYQNCATVNGYTQFPYTASNLIQEASTTNNQSCVPMP